MSYEIFERTFVRLLDIHAPLKEKCVRANNASFMNKTLSKAFMTRSRLRNKILSNPTESIYKKFRKYCTNSVRKEKRNFYSNLKIESLTDNKLFWKTVRPLFSEKNFSSKQITLLVDDKIISSDNDVAETFNTFFPSAVANLDVEGFKTDDFAYNLGDSPIENIIRKFRNHPSIVKIKVLFHLSESKESDISEKFAKLNIKKSTTYKNIPTKLLVETSDVISPSPLMSYIYLDRKLQY